MSIKRIRIYGDPVLRKKAEDIHQVDEQIISFSSGMIEILRKVEGIGLAGTQVGFPKNIFVIDFEAIGEKGDWGAFLNAKIIKSEGEETLEEGCLSFPGIRAEITRAKKVVVKALNLEGKEFEIEALGLLARAFQHEIDHLSGVLIIDRMRSVDREIIRRRLKNLTKIRRK